MAAVAPSGQTAWDHHPTLHAVQAAFDQMVTSRHGHVTLVAGGPASGRTGLARALAARLAGDPTRPVVVAGGFTTHGDWQPWPPPDPARLVAPLQAGIDLAVTVLELSGTLLPVGGAAGKLLGQLASASSAAWTLLSRRAEGKQALHSQSGPDSVRQMLRVAAGPQIVVGWQPVVCILDDLDHAPSAADWWRNLVLRLAAELRDLPLLLVATLDGPPVLGDHQLNEPTGLFAARRLVKASLGSWVPMGRLARDAVARWLWPCEPALAERLWEVTGGEPRWLEELWAHWRTTRVVRRDLSGEWVLAGGDDLALGKVHDLVWERLRRCYGPLAHDDQLDAAMRALAVGALEGRELTADAVAMVVGRDADELIDELDEHVLASRERPDGLLEEAGFVEVPDLRATSESDGERARVRAVRRYRFVSDLHWRTLRRYGFLGDAERRHSCRALAVALERALQPTPARAAAQLASLWREAGDPHAAARWQVHAELDAAAPVVEARARLLLAQDTAGWDRLDHAQTARWLSHATKLLFHQRPTEVVLEVAHGWARAARAAGWQSEHARALLDCGLIHMQRGEWDAAVASLHRARREAAASGDLKIAADAMVARARVELDQGRVQVARRRTEAARQLAQHHHAPHAEAEALSLLARVAELAGDFERALAAAAAGVALARRAEDQALLSNLLLTVSDMQQRLGRVAQARETAERALEAASQAGNRTVEGALELRLGFLWLTEDPQAAEGHLLRGLAIARQLDLHRQEVQCRVQLALLARDRGDNRTAGAHLEQATRLAHALGNPNNLAWVWRGWAELAEAQGVPGGQVAALWALAAVHLDRAGSAAASSLWKEAQCAATAAGTPQERETLAARARAALARDGGWELLKEVFAPVDTQDSGSGKIGPGG